MSTGAPRQTSLFFINSSGISAVTEGIFDSLTTHAKQGIPKPSFVLCPLDSHTPQ